MRRFSRCAALALGIGIVLLGEARAEGQTDRVDALFQEGKVAFARRDFESAAARYAEAWAIAQTFDVAANLGQAEIEIGRYRDAATHLRFAFDHLPPSVAAEVRREMVRLLGVAKQKVATLRVICDREGSEVSIDGVAIGKSPLPEEVFVDPGSHVVLARLPGYRPAQRRIEVQAATSTGVDLLMVPDPDAAPSGAGDPAGGPAPAGRDGSGAAAPGGAASGGPAPGGAVSAGGAPGGDEAAASDGGPHALPIVVGTSVTLIGLVTGIGYAIAASNSRTDRDNTLATLPGSSPCGAGTPFAPQCAEVKDLDDSARRSDVWTGVGFGVAGVAAVATLVYWIWPRGDDQEGARTAGHHAAEPERCLRIVPVLGLQGGTIRLNGAF